MEGFKEKEREKMDKVGRLNGKQSIFYSPQALFLTFSFIYLVLWAKVFLVSQEKKQKTILIGKVTTDIFLQYLQYIYTFKHEIVGS